MLLKKQLINKKTIQKIKKFKIKIKNRKDLALFTTHI
jgi:hypothetical protein